MEMTRFAKTASGAVLAALASGAFLMLATGLPVRTAQAQPIYAQDMNGYRLAGESRHRYGSTSAPRYERYGGMMGGYGRYGGYGPGVMGGYGRYSGYGPGMMGGYGSHGGYGPGMMGGYGPGPGMMGW
jgi:hypothetical protein